MSESNILAGKWIMKRRKIIDDYFTFTKKDRLAILVIICLLCFIFFAPQFFKNEFKGDKAKNDTAWISSLKKLEVKQPDSYRDSLNNNDDDNINTYQYDRSKNSYTDPVKIELFYFDPNTASPDDWEKLGLKNKTIQTIQKFLAKGGYFKQAEDLKKIYGLHANEYERLAPFVRIKEKNNVEINNYSATRYPANKHSYTVIDINAADTSAFISLPGIGSKLAARIIIFREKLGGFYSVGQIGETYGLPDSTFQKIKPYLKFENQNIRKININTATIDELKAHPYIRYAIANPIIAYRNQHGPFSKVEDIKKIMVVTDEIYEKIAPYLITQ